MSATPAGGGTGTSGVTPKSWPGRATAAAVLLLTALAGLLLGVVLERRVLSPHWGAYGMHGWHSGWPGGPPLFGREPPEAAVHRASARLSRALGLTDAQHARVDSIMLRRMTALRDVQRETEARARAMLEETRREIDSVLTPAQRDRFRAMHHGALRHGWGAPPPPP